MRERLRPTDRCVGIRRIPESRIETPCLARDATARRNTSGKVTGSLPGESNTTTNAKGPWHKQLLTSSQTRSYRDTALKGQQSQYHPLAMSGSPVLPGLQDPTASAPFRQTECREPGPCPAWFRPAARVRNTLPSAREEQNDWSRHSTDSVCESRSRADALVSQWEIGLELARQLSRVAWCLGDAGRESIVTELSRGEDDGNGGGVASQVSRTTR